MFATLSVNDSAFGNVFNMVVFYLNFYRIYVLEIIFTICYFVFMFYSALFKMFVIAEVIKKIPIAWVTSPTSGVADYLAVKLPVSSDLFVSMKSVQHMA